MAIQTRRGNYADFDPEKMLPGEPACVLAGDPSVPSGKAFYVCYSAGDVKRMVSIEDIEEMVRRGDFKGEKGDKGDAGGPGVGIKNVTVNNDNHLIVMLENNTVIDAGYVISVL